MKYIPLILILCWSLPSAYRVGNIFFDYKNDIYNEIQALSICLHGVFNFYFYGLDFI
jgi:hypothetical protein